MNATTGSEIVLPYSQSGETSPSEHSAFDRVTEERAAVQAVLLSNTFNKSPRLAGLLNYICELYFAGDTAAVKEFSIATEVFRRPQSFDPATDSIVRVEVFRLRKKLREFYEGEGIDQPLQVVVATGHYRPKFVSRLPQASPQHPSVESMVAAIENPLQRDIETEERSSWTSKQILVENLDLAHPREHPLVQTPRGAFGRRQILALGIVLAITCLVVLTVGWVLRSHDVKTHSARSSSPSSASLLPTGPEIRIRCGYSRPIFKDEEGTVWTGDRYFTGGFVTELPDQHVARTHNPELYLTGRTGVFSYKIPLSPGTYEMRLHFAETTYSPTSSLGGGENSRVFNVQLNGRPLLSQFDIVSDAGANTADVRVFRDVTVEKDGYLHLDFTGSLGLPILNAIEIVPGLPHRLRPIRMVAQNSFFVDRAGNLWMPDSYFSSGQLAADKVVIGGTAEPGLYAGERYGNFTYALPVDAGSYKVTLYFSEKYWGTAISKKAGVGSRTFDILCNGTALTRRLDIVKEAGPARALIKTYRDLRPNAQGKLILSFVPDANYATVDAVLVEEEAP